MATGNAVSFNAGLAIIEFVNDGTSRAWSLSGIITTEGDLDVLLAVADAAIAIVLTHVTAELIAGGTPTVLAQDERWRPAGGAEIELFDTQDGSIIDVQRTAPDGIAEFDGADIVDVDNNLISYGFRLRITRNAGKSGQMTNVGAQHLTRLDGNGSGLRFDEAVSVTQAGAGSQTATYALGAPGTWRVLLTGTEDGVPD